MFRYYPMLLGIVDQLNEWNDKLNKFAEEHMDGLGTGTIVFFALLGLGIFGVNAFNKKNQ